MTLGTKSLLVLSVCAALGCKKEESAATGPGSGSGPGSAGSGTAAPMAAVDAAAPAPAVDAAAAAPAANVPPELKALEDLMAPILAIADEDARTKAACKELGAITRQFGTVSDHPPAGVDPAAWREASEHAGGGLNDFGIDCGEGTASDTKPLAEAAERTKGLHALIPKKAN